MRLYIQAVFTLVAMVTLLPRPISGQIWKYQPIGEGYQSDSNMMDEEDIHDFRFISFPKMLQTGRLFPHYNLVSFVQIVVDEPREQLLVGGRDTLYRLHLDNLSVLEITDWASTPETRDVCAKRGQKPEECRNFIRVLIVLENGRVFICGTNAFQPQCTERDVHDLALVNKTVDGLGICPYSPSYNATALMTSSGDVYAATVIDSSAREPAISRKLGPSVFLRTMQYNSKWLDDPNFVSTHEIGNFIYFFFRETAVEYINCGKRIYSRVARVCKHDKGGEIYYLKNIWTSFHKARLNCSLPGTYPFYFDELQSTYYSAEEELIYAVFTTPTNSIAGSAVCVFNMTAIEYAFDGPFKHQESPDHAWLTTDNGKLNRCHKESNTKRSSLNSHSATKMYQLMDRAVQPRDSGPLIMREGERWTHIVVDHVISGDNLHDVVFLATEEGKIRKMVRLPKTNQTCLVEEIKIVENGHHRPVKNMKLSAAKRAIYISTLGDIIKLPVQRCYRFASPSSCINAQDPYCGWNSWNKTCSPPPDGNPHSQYWEQDFRRCPVLDYPVDGGWSAWSEWSVCRQVGLDPMVDHCLCRSRTCDRPKPANNGMECVGESMEVMNCTVHGHWTEWSAWGACDHTCGVAWKKRYRQCGNPPPKFGGRVCEGEREETAYCEGTPPCPLVPVDGDWSLWSGWSDCTSNCNGGMQTRKRGCDRPEPTRGGDFCRGNDQEWRMCNIHQCPEISKAVSWTEWIVTNRTSGGFFQQRFRFTCRANVESSKAIKSSYTRSQTTYCLNNDNRCFKPRELANTVTSIDTFSAVDRSLKKYCRHRRRMFKNFCTCRTLGVFLVCQKCGLG